MKYVDPKQIKPCGWLKEQLRTEAMGLCGNLDKIWPDVRDSAWIGGTCEGWERVPYWLDGFIPLAYLLDSEDMKVRAKKYMDAIISRQQPSGWICPCAEEKIPEYDAWAVFLIGKVLTVYHQYSGSRRAYTALYRSMKNLYELLRSNTIKLFDWGKFRWFECFIPIKYLYERKREDWLIELAKLLREQGADYGCFEELWKRPMNAWRLDTHIVNICMEMKSEAVVRALLGEDSETAKRRYEILNKYNGTAVEIFTGDECLSGIANNQGTELCAVNELMYSYEWLYIVTGDTVWLDRLERVAFNALPATFTEDMWAHQYVQQVNQISAYPFPGKSFFRTNNSEAHIFGLEPNFGCCTANASQGYPKLTTSIFAKSRASVIATMMLPAELSTKIGKNDVNIKIDTEYPFKHKAVYTVSASSPTEFEFKIRVPSFAKSVYLNGEEVKCGKYIRIKKVWKETESLTVELSASPCLKSRPNSLYYAQWGNLVFSLPIEAEVSIKEYEKKGVLRKFPYCDYHMKPVSDWNFGFASDKLTVVEHNTDGGAYSAKAPSVTLKARLAKVDWDYADGYDCVPSKAPLSTKAISEDTEVTLIPYGAAKLRMTEMPKVSKK